MAHKPLKMTIDETHRELHHAWAASYSPERNAEVIQSMNQKPLGPRIFHFISRLVFRAIYFPQTTRRAWIKVIFQNRRTVFGFVKEGLGIMLGSEKNSGGDRSSPTAVNVMNVDDQVNRPAIVSAGRVLE